MTYALPECLTATAALTLAGDFAAQAPPPMPKLLSSEELARQAVKTLAEEHGYIVVSAPGYRRLGGYGQHYDIGMRPPPNGTSAEEQERASKLN
jgi:hypothetical protein